MWNASSSGMKTLIKALLVYCAVLLILLIGVLMVWGAEKGAPNLSEQELFYLTLLVAVEAEGEPFEGKVGVAYVAMNRWGLSRETSLVEILFEEGQFTGFWVTRRVNKAVFPIAALAARVAYYRTLPDPTKGATHYLNVALTKKQSGKLPSWYNPKYITVVIGHHTFLKLY